MRRGLSCSPITQTGLQAGSSGQEGLRESRGICPGGCDGLHGVGPTSTCRGNSARVLFDS